MIRADDLQVASAGEPGSPGGAGKPGQAGGAGGAGGQGGRPGGHGGAGGAGGRGGDSNGGAGLGDLRHIVDKSRGQTHLVNYVTAAILLFLLGWAVLNWWQGQQAIRIESIKIDNVQILSESELCPGDMLVTGYSLAVEGLGEITFGDSVYHGAHPVKFSEPESLIVPGSRTLMTEDEWPIPPRPERAINGRREWAGGEYTRQVAVSASNSYVSRFTEPGILEVKFRIKSPEECTP